MKKMKIINMQRILLLFAAFLLLTHGVFANDDKRISISGYIKDSQNGETLIGASVYIKELQTGAVSNVYGFYSISLNPGEYHLEFSYVGYNSVSKTITLNENLTLNIELDPSSKELEEVKVSAERKDANIKQLEMSTTKLQMKTIKKIPAFMGEVDLVKAIQLLPGVHATSEGSSSFSVRGGAGDQNLILLDEATVYNASHLMGFFSVFNNDAIKDVKLYKGDIPAAYGGRLASLLDVRMKDGNKKEISGSGGIGTISSRFTIEGPIIKDKTSFVVSGRRTYADLFLPLAPDENLHGNKLYFYDLNAKVNHIINEKNKLYFSGYLGRDVFKNEFAGMEFGNKTFSTRWNHLFSNKLFSNITLIASKYDYELSFEMGSSSSVKWVYDMEEYAFKSDMTYFLTPNSTVKFGFDSRLHRLHPGTVTSNDFDTYKLEQANSLEHAIYISNEHKITPKFGLKYGLRYSLFQNIGSQTIYNLDEDYEISGQTTYKKGDIFNTYGGFEPRAGMRYELNKASSVKASYSRTRQYLQMATNGTSGTPLDLWFTASPNVKPQISDQVALGYFRNFKNDMYETSVEVFYKDMQNTIDFRDHANLFLNKELEKELRFGTAKAYGIEFLIRKTSGKLNGWLSYTYSHSERTIKDLNQYSAEETYDTPYDKPHNLYLVVNYELNNRITFGANWIYASGNPATFPVAKAKVGNTTFPVYSQRNTYRLEDYHRMDVSMILKGKNKKQRKWNGEWVFSVYNAYGHKNTWMINFSDDPDVENKTIANKVYLFSVIPAVTYNFKF